MKYTEETDRWLRVFHHEISRRRNLLQANPTQYWEIYKKNHKSLSGSCAKHCWVPATFLWIHDGAARSILLYGFRRRSFAEALPFQKNGNYHIPTICWNCTHTREKIFSKQLTRTASGVPKVRTAKGRRKESVHTEKKRSSKRVPNLLDKLGL